MCACLEEEEMGPRSEEIPEIGANTAYRYINLENALGGNDWERKNWEKNVLALSIFVLAEVDYADSRGCIGMGNTWEVSTQKQIV